MVVKEANKCHLDLLPVTLEIHSITTTKSQAADRDRDRDRSVETRKHLGYSLVRYFVPTNW